MLTGYELEKWAKGRGIPREYVKPTHIELKADLVKYFSVDDKSFTLEDNDFAFKVKKGTKLEWCWGADLWFEGMEVIYSDAFGRTFFKLYAEDFLTTECDFWVDTQRVLARVQVYDVEKSYVSPYDSE